jgi:hypothetical protein
LTSTSITPLVICLSLRVRQLQQLNPFNEFIVLDVPPLLLPLPLLTHTSPFELA